MEWQRMTKDEIKELKIWKPVWSLATAGFFGYGMAKDDEGRNKGIENMEASFKALEKFLLDSNQPYIGGEQARFNDFMFWPFLQKIGVFHRDFVRKNSTVNGYYERMLENKSVKACKHPDELERQFFTDFWNGKIDYEIQ